MYKIVRHYFESYRKRTILTRLMLEEARDHCRNPNSSSSTAPSAVTIRRTEKIGLWFDSFDLERK